MTSVDGPRQDSTSADGEEIPQCIGGVSDIALLLAAVLVSGGLVLLALRSHDDKSLTPQHQRKDLAQTETRHLLQAPRTVEVATELLRRSDVDQDTLQASLTRLARQINVRPADLLLDLITDLSDESPESARINLVTLSASQFDAAGAERRDHLARLAMHAESTAAREVALAAWMTIDQNVEAVYHKSATDHQHLNDFLQSLLLIKSRDVQQSAYEVIRPLLRDSVEAASATRELVIPVMVRMKGHETETASDLIQLLVDRQSRPAVVQGLSSLPADSWPDNDLGRLAAGLIAWIAEHPADHRGSTAIEVAFDLCEKLSPRLSEARRERFQQRIHELRTE